MDFDAQMVFSSGGDLTRGHCASRTLSHAKQDCSEVVRVHWSIFKIPGGEQFSAERFYILPGPFADGVKGLQIGTQRANSQPCEVFRHIEPVGADVSHRAQWPSCHLVDAPVPV